MSDDDWARYRLETFGDPYLVWHDGADFGRFEERARADPETSLRMLLVGIAGRDCLAAEAVLHVPLASAAHRRAVESLAAAVASPEPDGFRIAAAASLVQLTGERQAVAVLVDAVTGDPSRANRMSAALALRRLGPHDDSVEALEAGVADADYLVRYHCAEALLHYRPVPESLGDRGELFDLIRSTSGRRHRRAARLLGGAARAWLAAR